MTNPEIRDDMSLLERVQMLEKEVRALRESMTYSLLITYSLLQLGELHQRTLGSMQIGAKK